MKMLKVLVMLLVIVGALNWGLVGLFQFNLVEALLGVDTMATKVVYILVGLAAVLKVFCCLSRCKSEGSESCCNKE